MNSTSLISAVAAAAATPQQLEEISHKAGCRSRAGKGRGFPAAPLANSNSQTALDGGQLGWRKGSQLPQFILDWWVK